MADWKERIKIIGVEALKFEAFDLDQTGFDDTQLGLILVLR